MRAQVDTTLKGGVLWRSQEVGGGWWGGRNGGGGWEEGEMTEYHYRLLLSPSLASASTIWTSFLHHRYHNHLF